MLNVSIGNVNFELKPGSYITFKGNDDGTVTVKIVDDGESNSAPKQRGRQQQSTPGYTANSAIYMPPKKSDLPPALSKREAEELNRMCDAGYLPGADARPFKQPKSIAKEDCSTSVGEVINKAIDESTKKAKKKATKKKRAIVSQSDFIQGLKMRQEENLSEIATAELLGMSVIGFRTRKKKHVNRVLGEIDCESFRTPGEKFTEVYNKAHDEGLTDMDIWRGAQINPNTFLGNKEKSFDTKKEAKV